MGENLLAIDCGTQSVRALIFNPKGDLLVKAKVPIKPYSSSQPGWAEQDPEAFWNALCEACQQVFKDKKGSKASIAAVALTTQRSTVVNMDAEGKPLRPAIVWFDQRRADKFPHVGGFWGTAFDIAGARGTVEYLQAECEANWLNQHQPELWEKTHKFTFLSGYLTHKLIGEFRDSIGCQVGYMPFDYNKQAWAAKSHWYWQALATSGSDKLTLGAGTFAVKASLSYTGTPGAFDGRTQAEKDLEAVQGAIRSIISGGAVQQYSIGSRAITKMRMEDLLALESKLKAEVNRERAAEKVAAGLGNPGTMFVRFG